MSENIEKAFALNIRGGELHGFGKFKGHPMKWTILTELPDSPDGRMLVFRKKSVAEMERGYWNKKGQSDDEYTLTDSWLECDIYRWLNGEFLDEAFSPEERERMIDSVETGRVFVLSKAEVERCFPEKADRAFGVEWWLRDLSVQKVWDGEESDSVCVAKDGSFCSNFGGAKLSVFPAMWISRCPREECLARIAAWEVPQLKRLRELTERQAVLLNNLPDTLPDAEQAEWKRLKAAIDSALANADAKIKAEQALSKKLDAARGVIIDDSRELEKSRNALAKLGFLQFSRKREMKKEHKRLLQKYDEDEARYREIEQKWKEALDAKYKGNNVSSAKAAFDTFYNGLYGGEHLRNEEEIKAIRISINYMRHDHGLKPLAAEGEETK